MTLAKPFFFVTAIVAAFGFFLPLQQDAGIDAAVFSNVTVSATPQAAVVACGHPSGAIGRKMLVVENETGGGAITVTAELRTTSAGSNFSSGYLAVNGLAAGALSSDTSTPSEAGGRFCAVSAVSASSSVITVTLRKE